MRSKGVSKYDWKVLEGVLGLLGDLEGHLGGSRRPLGGLGGLLGRLGGVLGASWARLGASWGVLDRNQRIGAISKAKCGAIRGGRQRRA